MAHVTSPGLPDSLREFVNALKWTFARTMSDWPHEYIVREKVDENLFMLLVQYIRTNGYKGKFYTMNITYFDDDGLVYWTMGEPLEKTTIINCCRKEDSYEQCLLKGTLPDN